MTEEVFLFSTSTHRALAYVCGLAYSYPHRFKTKEFEKVTIEDIQECAVLMADYFTLEIDDCILFAAQIPEGKEFNSDRLGTIVDREFLWDEHDRDNDLPHGTTAAIGVNIGNPDVHIPDSRPED